MVRYCFHDIEYPSVSEIIEACTDKSDALTAWAAGECVKYIKQNINKEMSFDDIIDTVNLSRFKFREVSKDAMDTGSIVHSLIEDYIKFGIDKTKGRDHNEQVQNAFLAFLSWEKDNGVKWIESELEIYNNQIFVAGRLDAICIFQDKLYCIDFKSSRGFYDGYDLQCSTYPNIYNFWKEFIQKVPFQKVENCGILRLDKETGLPEWKDYSKNIDRKYEAFLKLVDFFYLYKNRRLKNNPRAKESK